MNEIVGTAIPNEFIGAIEKGFYEAVEKVNYKHLRLGTYDWISRG